MSLFPHGNRASEVTSWLGLYNTKSRIWDVAYSNGFSLIFGSHTLIFLGLENLQIGVVSISGLGVTAGVGTKAMRRGTGAGGTVPREQLGRNIDRIEDTINNTDYLADVTSVEDARSGLALLALMNQNASRIVAEIPFSFDDISKAWGGISGFNVDVMMAGIQKYWISMCPDVIAGDRMYFRDQSVYNLDGGSVGAGLGTLQGKWSVDRTYDLWSEKSAIALRDLGLSARPFETPDIRPNSTIPNAIHPFLRDLPILGYPISPQLVRRHFP
jgi:hypothetical protein